ncbi:MAG: hypothetical protein LBQ01_01220 [Prevotellaceae bacterium]|jgi:hypothetical protein|nr:hypothetical protein [Prevotellaceae bacterium]
MQELGERLYEIIYFFSPGHNQEFTTENVNLKIEKEQDNADKLHPNLNEMNISEYLRQKFNDLQQAAEQT